MRPIDAEFARSGDSFSKVEYSLPMLQALAKTAFCPFLMGWRECVLMRGSANYWGCPGRLSPN